MTIKEYRIVLPMSVEEYQVGQLYSLIEASKNETGGGEGVQVLENRPYVDYHLIDGAADSEQYTHKVYHLQSKVSSFIRKVAPRGSLTIHERSWNAYPYCRTELTNPDYMGDNFLVRIETMHVNDDRGTMENVHNLPPESLAKRDVVNINIANDHEFLNKTDYKPETSPQLFMSEKTGRGRLDPKTWRNTCEPVMCAYKLVAVQFKKFGFQSMVENHAHKQYPRLFCKFHREVFCWIDQWYGLTMENIRELERIAKKELDEALKAGSVRGTKA